MHTFDEFVLIENKAPPARRCDAVKTCCIQYGPNIRQRIYDTIASLAEITEGGAIGYTVYLIFADEDGLRGLWGYGLVAVVGVCNGVIEILSRIKPSERLDYIPLEDKKAQCRNFWTKASHKILMAHKGLIDNLPAIHRTKYTFVNSIIAGGFVADFVTEGWPQILTNLLISSALIGVNLPLQIAESRGHLKSCQGKFLKYAAQGTLAVGTGLGIGSGLLVIPEGFKIEVPLYAEILVWAFFALSLLAATFPKNTAGKMYRSAMYGAAITCFSILFWLDFRTDVTDSLRIPEYIFGLIVGGSVTQGIVSSLVHYFDMADRHHGHDHELAAAPAFAINDDRHSQNPNQFLPSPTLSRISEIPEENTDENKKNLNLKKHFRNRA